MEEKEIKKPVSRKKTGVKKTTRTYIKPTEAEKKVDELTTENEDMVLDMPMLEIEDELEEEVAKDFVSQLEASGDAPDDEWPEEKKKEWFTPRVYDENRPWIHIGVVCGMKSMKYIDFKKQMDAIMWNLPPWEYKHKIYGVRYSTNYDHIKRYAAGRKKPFQTCPIYFHAGPQSKLRAFEHLVRQIKGGVLLVMKDKEDGAVNKLIHMAKMYDITVVIAEY